jgi:hypothetical protein
LTFTDLSRTHRQPAVHARSSLRTLRRSRILWIGPGNPASLHRSRRGRPKPHLPERDLDEAALRQAHRMGLRFVRTIAPAMTRKYDIGTMRRLIRSYQDRACREQQKPIQSPESNRPAKPTTASSKSAYQKCSGELHSATPKDFCAGAFPIKPKDFAGLWRWMGIRASHRFSKHCGDFLGVCW